MGTLSAQSRNGTTAAQQGGSFMRQLTNYLGRLPLAGRLFRPTLHTESPCAAPAVVCRREPVLAGADLARSFGRGENRAFAPEGRVR